MSNAVPRYYAKPKVLFIKVDARHDDDGSHTELNRLMARIRATQYYFHYLYQCNDLFLLIYGISDGMRPAIYSPIRTPEEWKAEDLPSLNYDAMVREGRLAQLMVFHVLIDPLETRLLRHRRAVRLLSIGFHTLVKCCAQQSSDVVQLARKLHF